MTMRIVLCPRDGLSLKDSRSFNLAGGVPARGLPWPTPTTVAGAARSAVGIALGLSTTYGQDVERWRAVAAAVDVRGPLAVARRINEPAGWKPLWPAPRDAVRVPHAGRRGKTRVTVEWLAPQVRSVSGARVRGAWAVSDAETEAVEGLMLPRRLSAERPLPVRPWWSDDEFVSWLMNPRDRDETDQTVGPVARTDVRLAIDPQTLAARDQHLFAQPTYEMLVRTRSGQRSAFTEVGVALLIDQKGEAATVALGDTPWRLGGEARFAWAETLQDDPFAVPRSLTSRWTPSRRIRLHLVTPGRFENGWRPDWLAPVPHAGGVRFEGELPATGTPVVLRAAFVERPQWISGWDFAARRPKPSSAIVGAGAAYYFEVAEGAEPFTAEDVRKLWLSSIQRSDDTAARDGFGLVVPGAWPASAAEESTSRANQ